MKAGKLLLVLMLAVAFASGQEKNKTETFNGLKIEQATDAPKGVLKDTTGAVYLQLTLKLAPVQLENVSGQIFFTEQSSVLKGQGLIPFTNLTSNEIEAVMAQVSYLQAKKKVQ